MRALLRALARALGYCSATDCTSHSWDLAGCCGCGARSVQLVYVDAMEEWCGDCAVQPCRRTDLHRVTFPEPIVVTFQELERRVREVAFR